MVSCPSAPWSLLWRLDAINFNSSWPTVHASLASYSAHKRMQLKAEKFTLFLIWNMIKAFFLIQKRSFKSMHVGGSRIQLSLQHHAAHAALCNNDRERRLKVWLHLPTVSINTTTVGFSQSVVGTSDRNQRNINVINGRLTQCRYCNVIRPMSGKGVTLTQPISLACLWHVSDKQTTKQCGGTSAKAACWRVQSQLYRPRLTL